MTHKVGAKGQVVIPKAIRDELGIMPGDEVVFVVEEGTVRIQQRQASLDSLMGRFAGSKLMEIHEEDKRFERELEERKWARLAAERERAR